MKQVYCVDLILVGILNRVILWPNNPGIVKRVYDKKLIAIEAEPNKILQGQFWSDITKI